MSAGTNGSAPGSRMRVTVVGCSGSFAGPESSASCYLLEAPDAEDPARTWRVLLDLGSGALGALHRHTDPLTVDGVFISHLHPDHFFDLSGYYVMRKYHPAGPQPQIPVHGPKGIAKRVAQAYGLPRTPGMTEEFGFRRLRRRRPVRIGPFTVSVRRMDHPVEAFGFRVECGGAVVAYSGDTAACPALVDLASEADLLLAEAAFRDDADNPPHIHMTGSEAAEVAAKAGVRILALTHVPPWHEKTEALREATETTGFEGRVELAAEGVTWEL